MLYIFIFLILVIWVVVICSDVYNVAKYGTKEDQKKRNISKSELGTIIISALKEHQNQISAIIIQPMKIRFLVYSSIEIPFAHRSGAPDSIEDVDVGNTVYTYSLSSDVRPMSDEEMMLLGTICSEVLGKTRFTEPYRLLVDYYSSAREIPSYILIVDRKYDWRQKRKELPLRSPF